MEDKEKKVTVVLTSCGRLDLLERTINSFLALNTYPIEQYILNDDSGNREVHKKLVDIYGDLFTLILPSEKKGQSKALDRMYRLADTEYIVGLEDDWLFEGNPNFTSNSIEILQNRSDIHQIWFRDFKDHGHPVEPFENDCNGIKYKMLQTGYLGAWNGFSWNPRICRKSDWVKFFPNGFNEIKEEYHCNIHAGKQGYRAATLLETSCRHIGYQQHTKDYKW